MPYGLSPFVLLRGPLRESLVLVRALRLGEIPLHLGGWDCLFGRPFSGDLRLAVLPISLFLLRFVWRELNYNKNIYQNKQTQKVRSQSVAFCRFSVKPLALPLPLPCMGLDLQAFTRRMVQGLWGPSLAPG